MPEGLTNAAYGALKGVSEGAVRKWGKSGYLVRHADGSIDVGASDRKLKGNLDPARTKVRTVDEVRPPEGMKVRPLDCVSRFNDVGHRGIAIMGLHMLHRLPASVAIFATHCGAPVRSAFALRQLTTALIALELDDMLTRVDADPELISIDPDQIDDVDWAAKCRESKEPYDPAAWKVWLAEVNAKLEALPD